MSRIVRGESALVKSVQISNPNKAEAVPFGLRAFKGFSVDGTYTHQELETQIAKARQEGIREGAAAAEARASEPLRQALENLERVMDELSRFRRDLFKESEQEILDLIRGVAKRVVFKELSLSPELLTEVVAKAIGLLEKQKRLEIVINSKDFETFQNAKADFLAKFKGVEELEVTVDSNVEPGSALVKSQTLELDVKMNDMVDHLMNQISAPQNVVNEVNDDGDKV